MLTTLLAVLLTVLSLFLILLVLIQQGRGGGLAGAFGGMGGQSAFGTKAGDLFTKITIGVAAVWIFLCVLIVKVTSTADTPFGSNLGANAPKTGNVESVDPKAMPDQGAGDTGTPRDTQTPAEKIGNKIAEEAKQATGATDKPESKD